MIGILESQLLMSYSPRRSKLPWEWRDLEDEQPAETSKVVEEGEISYYL